MDKCENARSHNGASMWIVVAKERSNGVIGRHGDWISCRSVEEGVYTGGGFVFIGVIIMVLNVCWVLVKWGKMWVARKWPRLYCFSSSLNCLQHFPFIQRVPSHAYLFDLHLYFHNFNTYNKQDQSKFQFFIWIFLGCQFQLKFDWPKVLLTEALSSRPCSLAQK